MNEQQRYVVSPVKIFYSYAHEDERLREELERHLSAMRQQGMISEWHDRRVVPGTDWAQTIDEHLMEASVILLLISPDFLASDYCYGIEMRQALERNEANEAWVIPILVRPVDWQGTPFAHLQCLPSNAKPVTEWPNRDSAFHDVARGIRIVIEQLQSPSRSTSPQIARPAVSQEELKYRQWLLKRIHAFWIKGVLEPSLHSTTPIPLELQERPDAVANPWRPIMQESDPPVQSLPTGIHITQVYDDADGELLILGAPGAGKTTLLLELTRHLIDRARGDESHPMPVIFNLSSWAVRRQPLDLWLIEELNTKYQVPRQLSQSWVNEEQILPLLDGLDEVTPTTREECVQAINLYRATYSILPMVVCCRSADFFALETPLQLYKAVIVQPLTPQQIDQYLLSIGEPLVLHDDYVLRELATTPLMLNILTAAYQGQAATNLPIDASLQDQRRQVFASYVQHMLHRRGKDPHYSPMQSINWLSWLANQLLLHNQAEFSLERIQPDWLPTQRMRRLYHLLVKIAVGLIVGLIYAVVFGMAFGLAYGPTVGLVSGLIYFVVYGLSYGLVYGLDDLLVGGLVIGLIVGLLGNLLVKLFVPKTFQIQPTLDLTWSWLKLRRSLLIGLVYGMIYGLILWKVSAPIYGLLGGIAAWLICALVVGLTPQRRTEIKPAEALSWSWEKMGQGFIRGLLYGLVIGLIVVIATQSIYALAVGGMSVLIIAVITGLSGGVLREQAHIKPNQGIWRSLRHGLLLTLGIGLLVELVVGLAAGPFNGLFFGLLFGLLVGLQYGGIAFIQHFVLRFFLWRSKTMPWIYPRFLDYAAERILLRKVGGNYLFVHRLLLEYFASLYPASEGNQTTTE